jgi:phospholipid/cholesterol/gamma-HCH transport system substrate-binding protein
LATQANKFRVGLFIILGFLLLNGVLIWLGASQLFQESKTYVTYFEESVQGLDVGSAVKYRGVPLGRVSAIRLAPDRRLVEATMEIESEFQVHPAMRAKLASSAITGSAFLEIGYPSPSGAREPPQLTFPAPENYIPSTPSFLTDVMTSLGNLLATVQCLDLPGLVEEYRGLAVKAGETLDSKGLEDALTRIGPAVASLQKAADRTRQLLEDPRIDQVLTDAREASGAVAEGSRSARDLLADPKLSEVVTDTRAAAGELRTLAARLASEAEDLHLSERLDDTQATIREATHSASEVLRTAGLEAGNALSQSGRAVQGAQVLVSDVGRSLEGVLSRLSRAAALLEGLAASLQREPSRLLLEGPPPDDFR